MCADNYENFTSESILNILTALFGWLYYVLFL